MFEQEMEHRWAVLEVARVTDGQGQVGHDPMAGYSDYWLVYDEVHLLNIAVHPKFRRRSIGRTLVEACLEEAVRAYSVMVAVPAEEPPLPSTDTSI